MIFLPSTNLLPHEVCASVVKPRTIPTVVIGYGLTSVVTHYDS